MAKVTFLKRGFVQKVVFFETNDASEACMLAEMQAGRGVKLIVEAA